MQIKDKVVYATVVFLIIVAGVLLLFSVYNLYKTLASNWGSSTYNDTPSHYASCRKFSDNYELTVDIGTYDKRINDVAVQLVSSGGMTSDKEKVEIPFISKDSSDVAIFTLTGEPTRSSVIRISYVMDNFWKDESYSSVITSDFDCTVIGLENPEPVSVE